MALALTLSLSSLKGKRLGIFGIIMNITITGNFQGSGAWGTVTRHIAIALEKRGHTVLRNVHNVGNALTPIQLVCGYPPKFPNVRHAFNACWFAWEFDTLPNDTIHELNRFDLAIGSCKWVADTAKKALDVPVTHCHHGFDPEEFCPGGESVDWSEFGLQDKKVILWVGGTDRRHGFDVALKVIDLLPDEYFLLAKQSIHYPEHPVEHPRVKIVREDFPSLSLLYRSAHCLLHTSRAVGFSLPVLEALACGCPVITQGLAPLNEYAPALIVANGKWSHGGKHHIYPEVPLRWKEPHAPTLAAMVKAPQRAICPVLTWDVVAGRLDAILSV